MAAKKTGAEKAVAAAGKKKKPLKKDAKAAKGKVAAEAKGGEVTGDNVGIGHNTKIPSKKDLSGFMVRLDKLHEEKAEKNAAFMSDIKGIYGEMAAKFGVSRKISRMFYGIAKSQESLADQMAEFEKKEKDDMDRLIAAGQSFGSDTPFGAWCIAQGDITVEEDAPTAEIVTDNKVVPIKTVAQAAADAIAADGGENKTTH
jgi:uncharacterized protein (UPF0335 family)